MSLPTAYPLVSAKPVAGVLPPAYGTSAYAGALPLAYGNTEVVLLDQFGHYEGITYTADTNLCVFNSAGNLTQCAANTLTLDYDPSTLALRGYPFWEARTNSLRNNTMQGAAAGTPGTLPTYWSTFTTLTGLTRTLAFGTENGINYCDFTLSGTPSAAGSYYLQTETNLQVASSNGQIWTSSAYYKLAGGSLNGITTINNATSIRDGAGAELGRTVTVVVPTAAGLATQRTTTTETNNSASTASELHYIEFVLSGAAINITLRIGLPQLELGAFATPVIKTTSAAVTRAAPTCTSTLTGWYNQAAGTFVVTALKGNAIPSGSFPNMIEVGDGTNNNHQLIYGFLASGNNRYTYDGTNGGVSQWSLGSASSTFNVAVGSQIKIACSYVVNDIEASLNGSAKLTDSSATIPAATTAYIAQTNSGNNFNGWISSLTYYPAALSSSLQTLST